MKDLKLVIICLIIAIIWIKRDELKEYFYKPAAVEQEIKPQPEPEKPQGIPQGSPIQEEQFEQASECKDGVCPVQQPVQVRQPVQQYYYTPRQLRVMRRGR